MAVIVPQTAFLGRCSSSQAAKIATEAAVACETEAPGWKSHHLT